MEMFFLIISTFGHPVVMPERYPKEQCEKLAARYAGTSGANMYIPAPSFPFVTFVQPNNCTQIGNNISCTQNDTLNQLDKRYPGYTCGGRDSECRSLKE